MKSPHVPVLLNEVKYIFADLIGEISSPNQNAQKTKSVDTKKAASNAQNVDTSVDMFDGTKNAKSGKFSTKETNLLDVSDVSDVSELSNDQKTFLDCTLGYGGHTSALAQNPNLRLIGCDRDETALNFCRQFFNAKNERVKLIKSDFASVLEKLTATERTSLRGILADIGVSSLHLDCDERGFSLTSGVLDMRMDTTQSLDAKAVVNSYSHTELTRILREFGELPNAEKLAHRIVSHRNKNAITSAKELASLFGEERLHGRNVRLSTLVFQAIRIEVNGELAQIRSLLNAIKNSEIDRCIVAVIAFHSIEDGIVKNAFRSWEKPCICPPEAARCECGKNHAIGRVITKKPLVASADEIATNPRASSAKLRAFYIERNGENFV